MASGDAAAGQGANITAHSSDETTTTDDDHIAQ